MDILSTLSEVLARRVEEFIFNAVKPGGFADRGMPVPNLKDRLAWTSWANLMRSEQPTIVALEKDKIVGVLIGEPIETTFDIGESEIQDVLILPEFQDDTLVEDLMNGAIEFYKQNRAEQTHVWCLKSGFENKTLNPKCKIATEKFGFEFKGVTRVSKWTGKEVVKLELYY